MIQSPILRALSVFLKHKVNALLIGGQACILYGAAEFSRDIDLVVAVSSKNLLNLRYALDELEAERIFVPELREDVLLKGHACHFRCQMEDVKGLRIDIIGIMRGVDPFSKIWKRRQNIELPEIGNIAVIGLVDLIKAKKTQRDKDWPMIRRLIEVDIYNASSNPLQDKICFWLAECRTPKLLVSLATKYPNIALKMTKTRPLLISAIKGNHDDLQKFLRDEEDKERELDRQYWVPLKTELEAWRRKIKSDD